VVKRFDALAETIRIVSRSKETWAQFITTVRPGKFPHRPPSDALAFSAMSFAGLDLTFEPTRGLLVQASRWSRGAGAGLANLNHAIAGFAASRNRKKESNDGAARSVIVNISSFPSQGRR
jgi:hypothetical protein